MSSFDLPKTEKKKQFIDFFSRKKGQTSNRTVSDDGAIVDVYQQSSCGQSRFKMLKIWEESMREEMEVRERGRFETGSRAFWSRSVQVALKPKLFFHLGFETS